MTLIKTLGQQKYKNDLQHGGQLRLGSLAAYRSTDGVRKDSLEGTRSITFNNNTPITFPPEKINDILPGNIQILGGYFKVMPGAKCHIGTILPDAYLFCVSETRQPKFGDTFFSIANPELFKAHVLEVLRGIDPQTELAILGKMVYGEKQFRITEENDIAKAAAFNLKPVNIQEYFTKPKGEYEKELEYRFAFFTKTQPLSLYTDLKCDPAIIAKCCDFS